MEKKAFYTEQEAKNYATELADEVGGRVAPRTVTVGCSAFDIPDELESWSGEINAYEVENSECKVIAYIAYWD